MSGASQATLVLIVELSSCASIGKSGRASAESVQIRAVRVRHDFGSVFHELQQTRLCLRFSRGHDFRAARWHLEISRRALSADLHRDDPSLSTNLDP